VTSDDLRGELAYWLRIPPREGWCVRDGATNAAWRVEANGRRLRVDDDNDLCTVLLWSVEGVAHGTVRSDDFPGVVEAVHEAMRLAEQAAGAAS
jgi:hypothetical protein